VRDSNTSIFLLFYSSLGNLFLFLRHTGYRKGFVAFTLSHPPCCRAEHPAGALGLVPPKADQRTEGEENPTAGGGLFWFRQAIGRVAPPGESKTLVGKGFVDLDIGY